MATAITHAFVALAMGKASFRRPMPMKFWLLSMACAAGPDLDVGLHSYGVHYEDLWGHRGMTHSLLFALIVAIIIVSWLFRKPDEAPWPSRRWWLLTLFFVAVTASHGIIDAFTNGGLGIAFFAPFDDTRYFFPWQPIEVAPLGLTLMFTREGWTVIRSELLWVWLPVAVLAAMILLLRRVSERGESS